MTERETRIKRFGKGSAFIASGVLTVSGVSALGYLAYEHEDEIGEVTDAVYGFITEDKCKLDDQDINYARELNSDQEITIVSDLKQYAEDKALDYHLTLIRSQPFVKAVESADTKTEITETLNTYGANFPFNIDIPTEVEPLDFPFTYSPVDQDEIDLETYQGLATDFLSSMHFIPREIVELSNMDQIKLVNDLKLADFVPNPYQNSSEYFSSVYWPVNKTIYISLNKYGNEDRTVRRFLSAFSSAVDFQICGTFGSQRDSVFADINPDDFSYGIVEEHLPNITTSISGQIDIIRDKMNITKDHVIPHGSPELFEESKIVQQKANLIASRIDEFIPQYYDYWISFLNVTEADLNTP